MYTCSLFTISIKKEEAGGMAVGVVEVVEGFLFKKGENKINGTIRKKEIYSYSF